MGHKAVKRRFPIQLQVQPFKSKLPAKMAASIKDYTDPKGDFNGLIFFSYLYLKDCLACVPCTGQIKSGDRQALF